MDVWELELYSMVVAAQTFLFSQYSGAKRSSLIFKASKIQNKHFNFASCVSKGTSFNNVFGLKQSFSILKVIKMNFTNDIGFGFYASKGLEFSKDSRSEYVSSRPSFGQLFPRGT